MSPKVVKGVLWPAAAVLVSICLLLPMIPAQDPGPGSETMFRFGNQRQGTLNNRVPDSGSLLWTFTTGDQVQSSPVPHENVVYFGSDDGKVYAVDTVMGEEEWTFDTGEPVLATPTIVDDVLYIGSSDTVFYALDVASGEELWSFQVPDPFGQIKSSAAVDGERAYFGTADWRVYAVNLTTHEEDWNFTTDNEVWSSPALWDEYVYFGSLDGQVYCLWRDNGTLVWNFSTPSYEGIYSSPAVVDDVVVFGSAMGDEAVYALNARTGEAFWRFQAPGPVYGSAAIHNDTIFIPAWGPTGRLWALPLEDPSPGEDVLEQDEALWSAEIRDEQGGSSPMYSQGRVLVGSDFGMGDRGRLFCFDVADGTELWNLSTGGDVYSSPSLMDGVAFIGSNDGRLYAVGGDPDARVEVQVIPEDDTLQGGRVMGISFLVTYRGLPLEGAFVKVSVSKGELSQSGASTFPDGSQRIKYEAPDTDSEITVRIDAEATFFGVESGQGSANITVVPASDYKVASESAFSIMNYALYVTALAALAVVNVAVLVLTKRVAPGRRPRDSSGKGNAKGGDR